MVFSIQMYLHAIKWLSWEWTEQGRLALKITLFEDQYSEIDVCALLDEQLCQSVTKKDKNYNWLIFGGILEKLPSVVSSTLKIFYFLVN